MKCIFFCLSNSNTFRIPDKINCIFNSSIKFSQTTNIYLLSIFNTFKAVLQRNVTTHKEQSHTQILINFSTNSIPMPITILRLGHRHYRDQRLTTHIALTARALGAKKVILSGEKDEKIIDSVKDIKKRWGGDFEIEYQKNFRKTIKEFKGKKLHLTMYGLPVQDKIKEIKTHKDLLIILGSEKVPGDIYHMADYNISIGSQPHSEVAALAILMHEYFEGKELNLNFKNPQIKLKPCKCGKDIITS